MTPDERDDELDAAFTGLRELSPILFLQACLATEYAALRATDPKAEHVEECDVIAATADPRARRLLGVFLALWTAAPDDDLEQRIGALAMLAAETVGSG